MPFLLNQSGSTLFYYLLSSQGEELAVCDKVFRNMRSEAIKLRRGLVAG